MGHSSGIYHPLAMGNVVKKNRGSDGNSCPNQKYEYNPAIIADHGLNYIYNIYISERVFFGMMPPILSVIYGTLGIKIAGIITAMIMPFRK
jgi:hypothetical protein